MKKCFACQRNLPLFMFDIDTKKYSIPINKGRVFTCKFCELKREIRQGYTLKWNGKDYSQINSKLGKLILKLKKLWI